MACGHGCLYCDGRAERYHVEGDFASNVTIRLDAPERLKADLAREREIDRLGRRSMISLSSGISDVYQDLERDHGLTRACLTIALEHGFPVLTMTKSTLWLRDLDIWTALSTGPGAVLYLSLNTLDDKVRRHFEPGAPRVEERLEAMGELQRLGIPFGILAMPLLPELGDSKADSGRLLTRLAGLGPAFIMAGGLTLRPGRQKDCFLEALGRYGHPSDLGTLYRDIYREERPSGMPRKDWYEPRRTVWAEALEPTGIPPMLPHRIFKKFLPPWESLHLLLQHMIMLYQYKGQETGRLVQAANRYKGWLEGRRSDYRRHRTGDPLALASDFESLFQPDGLFEEAQSLEHVLLNDRLSGLVRTLYGPGSEDRYFDYCRLRPLSTSPGTDIPN